MAFFFRPVMTSKMALDFGRVVLQRDFISVEMRGPAAPAHVPFLVRRGEAAPHQKGDFGGVKPRRASRPRGSLVVVVVWYLFCVSHFSPLAKKVVLERLHNSCHGGCCSLQLCRQCIHARVGIRISVTFRSRSAKLPHILRSYDVGRQRAAVTHR